MMDKAKSASISLPQSYWVRLQKIADTKYCGNRTAAIRDMIEAHEALSEDHPIGDLIAKYAPLRKAHYKQAVQIHQDQMRSPPDENLLLLKLLEQSIKLVAGGSIHHFTALGANELQSIIDEGRKLNSAAELSHFVDQVMMYEKHTSDSAPSGSESKADSSESKADS
ncbi:MAG: putative metal-dependent hydrolase [Lentimonas sp.]|jgi:predicted metal-dependent hydrolase